jgi:hypothetical protein
MKKIIFILIIILLLPININCQEEKMDQKTQYGILLSTDNVIYQSGKIITIKLKVFNYSAETIDFYFNSSQRYDFIIEDAEGNEIWRWSNGRMFAMVLGEEILGLSNPEVIYTAEYKDKLSPGYYKITGIFTAQDRPMFGSIIIEVK